MVPIGRATGAPSTKPCVCAQTHALFVMKPLIVITGASSGIGLALCRQFSELGHPVLMLARRADVMNAEKLSNAMARAVDVTDASAVAAAIAEAETRYGKTDLLINCAGVMLLGLPQTQSIEEWKRMIDVNVTGVLNGIHAVIGDMSERGSGTIINISSIAGRKTFERHSVYCASKFAVHALTESMRAETAERGVRFITIAPGVVETPLLSHTSSDAIKADYNAWKETIEGGLEPQKIVECVLFAYRMPQDVCVREIVIAKTKQKD